MKKVSWDLKDGVDVADPSAGSTTLNAACIVLRERKWLGSVVGHKPASDMHGQSLAPRDWTSTGRHARRVGH